MAKMEKDFFPELFENADNSKLYCIRYMFSRITDDSEPRICFEEITGPLGVHADFRAHLLDSRAEGLIKDLGYEYLYERDLTKLFNFYSMEVSDCEEVS
ncbi:hypothetical protein [Dipodfec virus UOA04_Rod_715]|nr:hypothetical protein [Dipodfec virus UOA04_Rod_715]